jgi:hypothetical protein
VAAQGDANAAKNRDRVAAKMAVGRKINIQPVMQLFGRRDAALRALASPPLCRSGDPALSEPVRKGLAGLSTDAGAID